MLLADQYKAPPATAPSPSVAGFKEWLERQPREGVFNYSSGCKCAAAQYLKSIGAYAPGWTMDKMGSRLDRLAFAGRCRALDQGRYPTFGDVLAEIEKAGL